jgi:PAS domain S-box-containing protein
MMVQMQDALSESERRLINKLHESQHFLEQVTNNSPDIIYVLNLKENRFTYMNSRVDEIMGPDNIMLDKIHPLDHDYRKKHILACSCLKKNETLDIDYRMKVKDGSWHWFHVRDIAFKTDGDGMVTHVVGVARDVHEFKLREEKLAEREDLLQRLLSLRATGIVAYRAVRNKKGDILDYEFVLVSKQFADFHQRHNLVGRWLFEEFPEVKSHVYDVWKDIIDEGKPVILEQAYPEPTTKKTHWFRTKHEKFGDGILVVWEDITEQKVRSHSTV